MSYVALYRAYRPQSFKEVKGQQHIVKTIKNAIITDKVAHAYLFSGPRGTGKTSVAKIIAKAINCPNTVDGEPCNECDICKGITKGSITDVVEIDAASNNGVDEIREIRDKVKYLPSVCRYKVYIIDEVHMLSTGAFNALLKTLEEPPMHVIFILATTEVHKIPLTIISRTQRFDFRGVGIKEIKERIDYVCSQENIKISEKAKNLIATNAEGGMRDALSLLDEAVSFSGGNVEEKDVYEVSGSVDLDNLLELSTNILNKNCVDVLNSLNKIIELGKEISKICSDLISFYRDVLLYKNSGNKDKYLYQNQQFIDFSKKITNQRIYFYLNVLNEAQNNMRFTNNKQTYLELAVIRMSDYQEQFQVDNQQDIDYLRLKLEQLEKNMMIHPQQVVVENHDKEIVLDQETQNNITVKMIENVLNNGSAALKKEIDEFIKNNSENGAVIKLLKQAKIVAVGDNKAIFVVNNLSKSDYFMKYPFKENVLNLINQDKVYLDDYYALSEDIWKRILDDYKAKYATNKKPTLDDFVINIAYYAREEKTAKDSLLEIFGDNIKFE